jgi:deoxyribose-phosphate aldolase
MTPTEIAHLIDHTALKPDTVQKQIELLCKEATKHHFHSVCVNPVYVPIARRLVESSKVKVCTVVGFPLGAMAFEAKAAEAKLALEYGAHEIDMVLWIGGLKAGEDKLVGDDIAKIAQICHSKKAILKVIFECALLTDEEKRRACRLCISACADYVKTSTGFSTGGATIEDVHLMSQIVKDSGLGVKAAGGIRTFEDVLKMIQAGATRLGTSSGVTIIEEAKKETLKG